MAVGLSKLLHLFLVASATAASFSHPQVTSSYRRSPGAPQLSLEARVFDIQGEVEQVHISLIGVSSQLAVNWVTPRYATLVKRAQLADKEVSIHTQGCTTEHVQSIVQYGPAPGVYTESVGGTFTCYSTGQYDSGLLHSAVIGPLQPSTTYYYRCGDPARGMSQEFSFSTPPAVGSQDAFPLRLGLLGDVGQTEHSVSTMQHLQGSKPAIVVNVGDLSYADGEQLRWDTWGSMIEPLHATIPMMVIEGNHEIEEYGLSTSSNLSLTIDSNFVAYETRFFVPSDSPTSYFNSPSRLFYSYELGGVHVIMLGSYAPFDQDSLQYEWLLSDLTAIDRQLTPWVIVAMHAPWYNSNGAHQGEADDMVAVMEEVLYKHNVDLVFAGHVHAYERTDRVYNQKFDECGPRYVVIGDGGNREGLAGDWLNPQPEWSLYRESSYGHGTLDLLNATHALWRWVRNEDSVDVSTDEYIFDRVEACLQTGQTSRGAELSRKILPGRVWQQHSEQVIAS